MSLTASGGGGMAMGGGMSGGAMMSGNAMAMNFNQAPQMPQPNASSAGGAAGAGGAFDLRGRRVEEAAPEVEDDPKASLGIDLGTEQYSAVLHLKDRKGGLVPLVGPLPATLVCDPVVGVKGLRKWLYRDDRGDSMPKGWKVSAGSSGKGGMPVEGLLRLLGLRAMGEAAVRKERLGRDFDILPCKEDDEEFEDTSGIQIRILSPDAAVSKDRGMTTLAENVLAILLTSLKIAAKERYGVSTAFCALSVPSSFGDVQRVALQKAVYTACMTPALFISTPLAAALGASVLSHVALPGDKGAAAAAAAAAGGGGGVGGGGGESSVSPASGGKKKGKSSGSGARELTVSVSVGASCIDVGVVESMRDEREDEGEGEGQGQGQGGGQQMRLLGSAGDSYSGGLDMERQIAKALMAAIEDRHGEQFAKDKTLLRCLLKQARLARETLSSSESAEVSLPQGCSSVDPSFEYSTSLSRGDMEAAAGGMLHAVRTALTGALEAADVLPAQVQRVILTGGLSPTSSIRDEVITLFKQAAAVEQPGALALARGAAIALALSKGNIARSPASGGGGSSGEVAGGSSAITKAVDVVPRAMGLVDVKKCEAGADGRFRAEDVTDIVFAAGAELPLSVRRTYEKISKMDLNSTDLVLVQQRPSRQSGRIDGSGSGSGSGRDGDGSTTSYAPIRSLGNPLLVYNERGFPLLANAVTLNFTLDRCGLVGVETEDTKVPDTQKREAMSKKLRMVLIVLGVLGAFYLGYLQLKILEEAPERAKIQARVSLESFYAEWAPDKLESIPNTLNKYYGRYPEMYRRLEKKYGVPVPKVWVPHLSVLKQQEREREAAEQARAQMDLDEEEQKRGGQ